MTETKINTDESPASEESEIIDALVITINAYEGGNALFSCQGQALDGYSALAEFVSIARKARKFRQI